MCGRADRLAGLQRLPPGLRRREGGLQRLLPEGVGLRQAALQRRQVGALRLQLLGQLLPRAAVGWKGGGIGVGFCSVGPGEGPASPKNGPMRGNAQCGTLARRLRRLVTPPPCAFTRVGQLFRFIEYPVGTNITTMSGGVQIVCVRI